MEDDPQTVRSLRYLLKGLGTIVVAQTAAEASAALADRSQWCGWIVDVGLPDGCGLALVEQVRPRFPGVPILFVTGDRSTESNHRIFRLNAQHLMKPIDFRDLVPFIARCLSAELELQPLLESAFESAVREYELAASETAILALALQGFRHAEILRERSIKLPTLKTQLHSMLAKTRSGSIEDVVILVLQRAIQGGVT